MSDSTTSSNALTSAMAKIEAMPQDSLEKLWPKWPDLIQHELIRRLKANPPPRVGQMTKEMQRIATLYKQHVPEK